MQCNFFSWKGPPNWSTILDINILSIAQCVRSWILSPRLWNLTVDSVWNTNCTLDPTNPNNVNCWWQFSIELRWLLDYLKILVASLVPAQSNCKDALTPQGQFRQVFHLDQLSWICDHYTELLCITHCVCHTKINDNPNPIVLCVTDNTIALNWTLHTTKKLIIGRALARFFYGILIGSRVGINAKWISTTNNKIANKILRLKATNSPSTNSFTYDYSNIQHEHEELKACIFTNRVTICSLSFGTYYWLKVAPI